MLTIPLGVVPLASAQPELQFFEQFLSAGKYATAVEAPIVTPVIDATNVTYFVPNTAEAVANFTALANSISQDELGAIFDYHVVPNFIGHSSDLQNGMVLQTAQGSDIYITIQGGQVFVNQAKVLQVDFLVANGVLHTLDRWVFPVHLIVYLRLTTIVSCPASMPRLRFPMARARETSPASQALLATSAKTSLFSPAQRLVSQ